MGTFPIITGAGTTTATKFFGDAMNRLSNMLNGVDISADAVVIINSATTWTFQNTALRVQNPAATFSYIFTPAAIAADRTLNLPLLTGTDTLAVLALQQTFTNKNLNASNVKYIDNADNTKILALSLTGITTGNTRTLTIPDVSSTIAVIGLAQTFTATQTITPVTANAMTINPASAPTGSASEFVGGIKSASGTTAFATTAQTGDFISRKLDQTTLTNPSTGTITNASTIKIVGAPIASTNVTITNAYALWVAGGNSLFAGTLTSTGGITMSSSDITLAGNKIKTTALSIYDTFPSNLSEGILFVASSGNNGASISVAPAGSSNQAQMSIFRTSDFSSNYEQMIIGTDFVTAEFAFKSIKGGTGTQRPINFYQGSTKLLSFDTANTITSYNDFLQTTGKKLSLNVGGTSYFIETSANQIDTFANSIQSHRVVVGATLTTEVNNVFGRLAALATTAADGFVYIPAGSGTPTGTPTAFTGKVAMYYDTSAHKIWFFDTNTSTWRGVAVT